MYRADVDLWISVTDGRLEWQCGGESPEKRQLEMWTKHMDDGRLLWLFTPQCHHKRRWILGPFTLVQTTRLRRTS